MGLHQALALCVDHCDAAGLTGDGSWFKTVVLAGGSACLPGLAERLEKELHDYLPSSICNGIRVIPPPCGVDTAWHGAKLISNLCKDRAIRLVRERTIIIVPNQVTAACN
ncbi:hypothetical protein Bca4012_044943 [Brassica carinata]